MLNLGRAPSRGAGAVTAAITFNLTLAVSVAAIFATGPAAAQAPAAGAKPKFANQGVTDTEIVIGTHQDLSGPIKGYGVNGTNGMKLAVDEINAAGGINGRKLRLVVEDSGYDPKKAVLGSQKMIERDKIFALVGGLGSPTTLAAQPVVLAAGVFQFLPITSAEFTYKMDPSNPQDRLKFANTLPYPEATRATVKYMVESLGAKKPCVLYQDDEFGKNVLDGFTEQLNAMKIKPASITSYKRGATDFSSQIARMKADGCDLVVLGTIIRETVGAMTEARKIGWSVPFVGSAAANVSEVPALGKENVEGFYATGLYAVPYADTAKGKVKDWVERYRAMFGTDPNTQSIYGYGAVAAFAHFAKLAGKDLNGETMLKALESGQPYQNIFGGEPVKFSPTDHLALLKAQVQQIKDGRWVVLKEGLSY